MRYLMILLVAISTACGGGSNDTPHDAGPTVDSPGGPDDASCFTNPQTHKEIINACTNAQKIRIEDLRGAPPLLEPDGSLPPLPTP